MNFEKDIFISYAHIDDEALVEGEKGWISEFHRSLEIRLAQLLGEKPRIWRDSSLHGNHEFSDEIVSQFSGIAVLVSIITPRYVKSDWCKKEIHEFYRASEGNLGISLNNKSRIFKVIKTPVQIEEHPPEIQGLLGYEFFQIDVQTQRVKEFSKLYGIETQQAYWSRLDDVANDISTLLQEIKRNENSDGKSSKSVHSKTVYLAETSFDKKEEYIRMKRWLVENSFNVLPDKNMPLIAGEYCEEVKKMMKESDLSVHIVGTNYGLVPEGTESSKVVLQNAQGAEASKEFGLKRIIWTTPNNQIEDNRQLKFFDELQESAELQSGADLIIASIEELKFAIEDKFKKEEKIAEDEPSDSQVGSDDVPPQVYLICDEQDLDDIVELEDFLFEQGYDVIIPVFEGDQAELRLDHQENLKNCDAVIIYFGKGNDLWVRSKVRDLMKIAGYGRNKPLSVKSVIVASPETPQKKRFRSHDLLVINMLDKFDSLKLSELTTRINQLQAND